ncbi:MAG: HEPN domain-containing protein [Anaerolineae bacterium]
MQRAADWLKQAQSELAAARHLLAGGYWAWCCFTCQQAAEKALKAVSEHFRTPQFGHNLNLLLETVEARLPIANSMRMACARLNRYYIPTRYPDAFDRGAAADQFFRSDAVQAVGDAEEVVSFAESLISSA